MVQVYKSKELFFAFRGKKDNALYVSYDKNVKGSYQMIYHSNRFSTSFTENKFGDILC